MAQKAQRSAANLKGTCWHKVEMDGLAAHLRNTQQKVSHVGCVEQQKRITRRLASMTQV
jgi:hypothetical protein